MAAMAHLRFLLILLWVGVEVSFAVDLHKRIIGGRNCRADEHQHHVALVENNEPFCGGTLIQNGWILTAAHCLHTNWHVDVSLTRNNFNNPVRITEVHEFHAERCHDLMLLKLPNTGCIPPQMVPIELPDCSRRPNVGDRVSISGHASNRMGPNNQRIPGFTPDLQCVDIDVTDPGQLTNQVQQENSYYSYQHWFAIQSPGVDICLGDSGGGVVFNGRIHGVIAYTGNGQFGCVSPAGFMDLCHPDYLKWIKNTTKNPRRFPNCFG